MKTHLLKLKAELKVLAEQIRTSKPKFRSSQSFLDKNYPNRHDYSQWKILKDVEEFKVAQKNVWDSASACSSAYTEFRSKHIAYCLLRGRTMEQIEPKLRNPGDYTHTLIRKQAAKIVADVMKEVSDGAPLHADTK